MRASDEYLPSGWGWALPLLALCGTLTYCHVTRDPTEGLDYASGAPPVEMANSLCSAETGPCPPTGFKWSIPAAGSIETLFDLDDPELTELWGAMDLQASAFVNNQARDCPAVVDWAIAADGRLVAGSTVRAGEKEQSLTGVTPAGAKVVTLTARRTDAEACPATFQWLHARLFEPS